MAESGQQRPGTWESLRAALGSRRIGAVTVQSFSSGLPLGLVWIALPAYLTYRGVDIRTVGLFQLAQAPWTFKFLWAPLLDRYEPAFLGRKRSWIVIWQGALLVGISLLAAAGASPDGGLDRRPGDPGGVRVRLPGRRDRRICRGRAREGGTGPRGWRPRGALPGGDAPLGGSRHHARTALRLAGRFRGPGPPVHPAGGSGRVVASAAGGSRASPAQPARSRL